MALYRSNKLATGACAPSLSPLPSLSALSSSDSASASRAEAAETFRAPAELAAAAAAAGAFRAMVVPRNTAAAAAAAASRRLSCAAGTADAIGFRAPKSPPPKLVAASTSLSDSEDSEEDSVDAVLSEKSSFTNGQSRWWLGTRRTSFRKASAAASAAPASPLTSAFGTGSKSGLPEAGDASAASLAPPPMAPGGTGGRGFGARGGGAGGEPVALLLGPELKRGAQQQPHPLEVVVRVEREDLLSVVLLHVRDQKHTAYPMAVACSPLEAGHRCHLNQLPFQLHGECTSCRDDAPLVDECRNLGPSQCGH
mmetsp:Transcript_38292/g.121966  ORF Transcript_38292/g.121966 Transcript_38292/m.121966 type:complete len:310 (-) Transcript_38292:323-1252(-)